MKTYPYILLTEASTASIDADNVIMKYVTNYWYVLVIVAVLLLIIILVTVRKSSRKKANQALEQVSNRLNNLKSIPLPYKLAKAVALARTKKDIGETVNQCQGDFDTIQENLKKMQALISDGEELVMVGKLKDERTNIQDINRLQDETGTLVNSLSGKLDEILQKENAERDKVNELKEAFRSLKMQINAGAANYVFCWEALEKMISDIEKEFSAFEELMYASEFDQASAKMQEIKVHIDQLNEVVEKIPELITTAKGDLPVLMENVSTRYTEVSAKGTYLDHLAVTSCLGNVSNTLNAALEKIKNADIGDVNNQLLECENRLDQLNQKIDEEDKAFDQLLSLKQAADEDMKRLTSRLTEVSTGYEAQSERFGIESWQQEMTEVTNRQKELAAAHEKLTGSVLSSGVPASTVLISLQTLDQDILSCYQQVNTMATTLEGASDDEQRAYQQLTKLQIVLAEVEARIRLNRLPAISQQYEEDLAKANDLINRLQTELGETPLNVSLLNSLLNMAIDFIYKLYESVNRILGTAIMVENSIVVGNRYRSSYADIDSELTRAELAYRNGEYTSALQIALKAIEKVHPQSVNKLISSNQRAQA